MPKYLVSSTRYVDLAQEVVRTGKELVASGRRDGDRIPDRVTVSMRTPTNSQRVEGHSFLTGRPYYFCSVLTHDNKYIKSCCHGDMELLNLRRKSSRYVPVTLKLVYESSGDPSTQNWRPSFSYMSRMTWAQRFRSAGTWRWPNGT